MKETRRDGYALLPALLVAGSFSLPLVVRAVEWLGLPREARIALPLLLGVIALAGVEQKRRRVPPETGQLLLTGLERGGDEAGGDVAAETENRAEGRQSGAARARRRVHERDRE